MAILEQYYDYELKREAYKLSGEKGYARNTTTLLKLSSIADTTMDYCTATFKLNVVGDKGESQIVIYDGDTLIPFTYNNTEHSYLEWSNQITSEVTISIKLTYESSHNILAKYLGNMDCVQSKSKQVSLIRDKPSTARTILSVGMTSSSRVYSYTSNPSASATLSIVDASVNPTANRNQTISFYDNGELIGTATTDNSGKATYTFSNMSRGYHTITAVYEGSEYLFGSENSTDCSKGYNVKIIDYPRYVLNDGDITITAQLRNFFDEPVPSKTMYLSDTSHTSVGVSGTTDSEGEVTLSMDSAKYLPLGTTANNMKSIPYTVKYTSGDYSETVTTIDSQNMVIEIDDSTEYITAINQTTTITGFVSPSRNGLFPVEIEMLDNGVTETILTNDDGTFQYNYRGKGVGDTTLLATISNNTDSASIEDLLQYWRANNKSLNKKYYAISGEFRELTNGFKLEFPVEVLSGGVSVGIGDGTIFEDDFELSFTIIGSENLTQMGVRQWKKGSSVSYAYVPTHTTVANGDIIKAISTDGTLKVYKNNVEISSTTAYDYYPSIWFEGNGKRAYLLFDNLKFKVI